jgi:hypothetical protein
VGTYIYRMQLTHTMKTHMRRPMRTPPQGNTEQVLSAVRAMSQALEQRHEIIVNNMEKILDGVVKKANAAKSCTCDTVALEHTVKTIEVGTHATCFVPTLLSTYAVFAQTAALISILFH